MSAQAILNEPQVDLIMESQPRRRVTTHVPLPTVAPATDGEASSKARNTATPEPGKKPAPKPDAPLTRLGRRVTAAVHAAVLVGLAAFVVTQLTLAAHSDRRKAMVTVVAPNLRAVPAPADGVFRADRHLPSGTHLQRGQVLGYLESPHQQTQLDAARRQLEQLARRKLLLSGIATPQSTAQQELRDVCERIVVLESQLQELRSTQQRSTVTSPVDGTLQYGISGCKTVTKYDPLAEIWQTGDDLLIEVRAPLTVIHRIVKRRQVEARFPTPDGSVSVVAHPIAESMKPLESPAGERSAELWGLVQCRPTVLPEPTAYPGALGSL